MKKSAIFIALLLILTSVLSMAAAAAAPERTEAFVPQSQAYLGHPGFAPLTVLADGSFVVGEDSVHFGHTTKIAQIHRNEPYPSTVHTFSDGQLLYTVQLFVGPVSLEGIQCLVLYARLTVENVTEKDVVFPAVSDRLVSLTETPGMVFPGNKAVCDYAIVVDAAEGPLPLVTLEQLGTFDDNIKAMETYWNTQLAGSFSFTELPEEAGNLAVSLNTGYVNLLCGIQEDGCGTYAPLLHKSPADISCMTCYDTALYFMKTGDADFLDSKWVDLQSWYAAICCQMKTYTFTAAEQEETVHLLPGTNATAALDDNLNALIQLKAFAYLCRVKEPEREVDVQAVYQKLLSSVETVMRNTVSSCTSHWSVTNLEGSLDAGTFSLCSERSAAAAVDWYKRDSIFVVPGGGTYLKRLARQQLPYTDQTTSIDAVVSQLEDDTIVIGQGIPGEWLLEGELLSFENYPLQGGGKLDGTITGGEREIRIRLSPTMPTAASLEFPVLLNNIEYASCGFDSENGIVSVPAGITEITVHLKKSVGEIAKAYQYERALEAAIATYEGIHPEEYTKYSVSLFEPALKDAKAARTGPASEMHKAAVRLERAGEMLSRTQSAYVLTMGEASDRLPDMLKADKICQTFAVAGAGTLSEVLVTGAYTDGITAAVYSLQKDGYSPGDLLGEARGVEADDGILFAFSVDLEADAGYLLVLYAEKGQISLPVYPKTQDAPLLYGQNGQSSMAYDLTCIGMSVRVTQANLKDLDTFLEKCISADISSYTKESRNRLEKEMQAAKELLTTPSVSEDQYQSVYNDLKDAYAALATYPSDDPVGQTPPALYIVLGVAVALLIFGGVGAVASYKKREW